MENHEETKVLQPEVDETELSDEELDEASGGIIIIGGIHPTNKFTATSKLDMVSLNPQPLPPRVQGNH